MRLGRWLRASDPCIFGAIFQVDLSDHSQWLKSGNGDMLQSIKATLTVTRRGVVTLPAKLRAALGLTGDDQLIAETTPDGLLLRPAVARPIEM